MKKIMAEEHWYHPLNKEIRDEYSRRTQSHCYSHPENHKKFYVKMMSEGIEEYRLKEMDENGVEMQILSHTYPGIQGVLSAGEAVRKAKTINDDLAGFIQRHPTRFRGFAALPMQDPKAAADELTRTVKDFGFLGALINGHTNGEFLDEDKFRVVWEQAVSLGVPIFLHPFDPVSDQIAVYKGYRAMLGTSWSWNIEAATHVMRIIYSGLFEELPEATLIIGHMGEMLPYILARIDEGYWQTGGPETWKIKKEPSFYYKRNVIITTSGLWNPESLICAISALGAHRILFAADNPFVETSVSVEQIEKAPVSREDKEKIYHTNARELFGI